MIMNKNIITWITRLAAIVIFTFIISIFQYIAKLTFGISNNNALVVDILIIALSLLYWHAWKIDTILFYDSASYRISFILGIFVIIALLIVNIINRPTSGITGQARSPFDVAELILFGPIAEELLFRGVLWSMFTNLIKLKNGEWIAYFGTSILFGISHLGYWAQSYWPLPNYAIVHALSMILAGMIFGILRIKSNSIRLPILSHSIANGIILLLQ